MPSPFDRILIIRPSSLGDVIRTVPALVSIRRAHPDSRIDWLVNESFVPAIAHHPDLTEAVPFDRRGIGRDFSRGNPLPFLRFCRSLRDRDYGLVIDFQGLFRSGLLTWSTRAQFRAGFADARELGWLGYTNRVRIPGVAHHVDRVLHLAHQFGDVQPDLRLYPAPADRERVTSDPQLAGTRFVLISPATRGLGRAWPIGRYASLAETLLRDASRLGIDAIVVVGLRDEADYCRPLTSLADKDPRLIDRVGATSISQLMALIERAALVVCNDSAAMHMAVAFSRPLVALLGPTSISHAGPYHRSQDVISHLRPDEKVRHRNVAASRPIMERITPDEVVQACRARLTPAGAS